jgi:hypothetical protein
MKTGEGEQYGNVQIPGQGVGNPTVYGYISAWVDVSSIDRTCVVVRVRQEIEQGLGLGVRFGG